MKLGRTLARVMIGALFVGHGTQKLFGWFGGSGREGTGGYFESIGLRPGKLQATAAGAAEAGGGLLLAVGLATPLGAAALSGVMLTAIRRVHWRNGVWVTSGGFEYNAVLLAALLAIAEEGPGPWSADAALGIERHGVAWALAALGVGAVGAELAAASGAASPAHDAAETSDADEPATA